MSHLSTVTESQSLRKQICLNTPQSMLDQWGKIDILPEIGGVITQQVSSYYQVDVSLIRKVVQRYRAELRSVGYNTISLKEFKNLQDVTHHVTHIPKARRIAIFPPPAIFCVGLLLRDSIVAKNLRSGIWEHLQNQGIDLINEEVLIESRSLRDEFCLDQNLGCLDRVGTLATIDDRDWSTVEQVADFYRVGYEAIKTVVKRNNKELKGELYRVLGKKELVKVHFEPFIYTTTSRLAIFPRRAILRVGMLLRDSEVAKDVRSYLLHAESQAPWREKKALDAPQNSGVSQTPDQGTIQEKIIGLLSMLQQEIKEEKQERQKERQRDRKEQKASLKDLEQTIRKLIWNSQEAMEKRLDFVELDSKGISQSCQSFYLGILGDFENLKGQKGWENKEKLLSRLTNTLWGRLLADIDEKHRQSMGRMNYFWQEMDKKFDQFELRLALFVREFNEKIKELKGRLDQIEIRLDRLEGDRPTRNSASSEGWKEKVRDFILKMAEDLKGLGDLLEN